MKNTVLALSLILLGIHSFAAEEHKEHSEVAGIVADRGARSSDRLPDITAGTEGRISSFLDPKSMAAFARTSTDGRKDVNLGKQSLLLDIFQKAIQCQEGRTFCVVDKREIERIEDHPRWQSIRQYIPNVFKRALDHLKKGTILAIRGSEFPLTINGVPETKGEAEALAETKEAHDTAHPPVFGYHFIPAPALFGDTIITTYAAKGYTFWSKSNPMKGLLHKAYTDQQAQNRIHFQQALGARYVFGTDIQAGGVLPEATGPEEGLNTLTPHIVLTTANLGVDAIRTNVGAFFAHANTAARRDVPNAHPGETAEQIKRRLAAESKANAVGVIDVEAVGGELCLGNVNNHDDHPSILPESRRLIVTTSAEGPLRIGNYFLDNCILTSLDLSPLSNVTAIGGGFLSGCKGLTSLDLSPLSNVTAIGEFFLSGCRGLTSLDLSPLKNVREIGNYFLGNCTGLTSLDLRGLENVTAIGESFLGNCKGLTSLDLSPLSNVTAIGEFFLYGCTGLTSLDLSPLSNVTAIGEFFLSGCRGLTSLDLSPLSNVTAIGSNFLGECTGLTSLDLSPLRNVTVIGGRFLSNCTGLNILKGFSDWVNITKIGQGFLSDTPALTAITPDFHDAPVPGLAILRIGGEDAVQHIRATYKR